MIGLDMKYFKFHHLSSCKMVWAMMIFIIFTIPSGHPMKYTFTQTFWLYVTVIYEYLEHIGLFTCNCHNSSSTELDFVRQYATNIIKSNLHMKKSN